jgi:hypothetical protein
MGTMCTRTAAAWVSLGAGLLLAPVTAMAAKVAIAPVEYALVDAGAAAPGAAAQIEDKIAEGAREAGYEVLRGTVVADAMRSTPECAAAPRDRACLEAIAEKLGVDEAIAVSVRDEDHTSYRIELTHARRDKVVDERTAGFFVVLEWLRGTIALTLQKPAAAPVAAAPAPAANAARTATAPVAPEARASDRADRSDTSEKSDGGSARDADRRKLDRAWFWSGVGLTGALAVSWIATDVAAWKAPVGTDGERDEARRMQVADGVLLGCALGAAVATTVVFFFTDFGKTPPAPSPDGGGLERGSVSTALAPLVLPDGGGFVLEGRF